MQSVLGWLRRRLGGFAASPGRPRKRTAHSPSLFDSLERREVLSTTVGPLVTFPAMVSPVSTPSTVTTTVTSSTPTGFVASPATIVPPSPSFTYAYQQGDAKAVATASTPVAGSTASGTPAILYGQPVVQGSVTVKASAVAPPAYSGQPIVPISSAGISATDLETDYVQSLYRDVLNRTGTPGEVAKWVGAMNSGLSYQGVASDFINSDEHRWNEVDSFYQEFLHRSPDPLAAPWEKALLSGASEESIAEAILGSTESQQAHPDPDQFIQSLYEDVLGRQAQVSERAIWDSNLASGMSRQEVISEFVNSTEAVDQVIEGYYAQFLHRLPDSTGSSPWADMLKAGKSASDVAIGILSSPEFVQKSTQA